MNNVKPPIPIIQKFFKPWVLLVLCSLALLMTLAIHWPSTKNIYRGLHCATKLNSYEIRDKGSVDSMLDASIYFKSDDKGTISLYGVMHDGVKSSVISRNLDFHYEIDGKFLLLTDTVNRKSDTDTAPDDAVTFGKKVTLRVEQLLGDDILISTAFIPAFVCTQTESKRQGR
ncbi:MAG: hypothetical protein ACRDCA_05900 [Serratia sp. (in: enterobacteria)]|uniref:hypothetical protein n=1 Tax=Serratia sp. (in: enterobacteria) TaxID=616 RepID=UPI003F2F8E2B